MNQEKIRNMLSVYDFVISWTLGISFIVGVVILILRMIGASK